MPTYTFAHEFAKPLPPHMLTDAAESGRVAMEDYGRRRLLDRVMAQMVTTHGQRSAGEVGQAYDGQVVTPNARSLAALGESAGFEVRVHEMADRCMVEGVDADRRMGFRAWWVRGSADACSWHEPWRYEERDDPRPIRMDAKKRVGLKGYRSTGMGTRRMVCVGSPQGLPLTYTDLRARLSSMGVH